MKIVACLAVIGATLVSTSPINPVNQRAVSTKVVDIFTTVTCNKRPHKATHTPHVESYQPLSTFVAPNSPTPPVVFVTVSELQKGRLPISVATTPTEVVVPAVTTPTEVVVSAVTTPSKVVSAAASAATNDDSNSVAVAAVNRTVLQTMPQDWHVAEWRTAVVYCHNFWRQFHGADMLQWSEELAAEAQLNADTCQYGHKNTGTMLHNFWTAGQNIWSWGTSQGSDEIGQGGALCMSVDAYYSEYDLYKAGNRVEDEIGHYTNIISKDQGLVGCGYSYCTTGIGSPALPQWYGVCNYNGHGKGDDATNIQNADPDAPSTSLKFGKQWDLEHGNQ